MNPRCEVILSLFQEKIDIFENYLIIYQNKELTLKGSNDLDFNIEGCYEKALNLDSLPPLLMLATNQLFSRGLDKTSFYNDSTKQKLLGCTILIPECLVVFYYESGQEKYVFGEELSSMIRDTFTLYPSVLHEKL